MSLKLGNYRNLIVILTISLLMGFSGIGRPFDQILGTGRYWVDPIKASGDIVIVGIDKKSVDRIGAMPWSRGTYAAMIDKLYAAGAKRVAFDVDFSGPAPAADDAALRTALIRNPQDTWLTVLPQQGSGDRILASSDLADHAHFASVNARVIANIIRYYQADQVGGKNLPPLPAVLAGREADPNLPTNIPVNYAMDAASFPYMSASDILTAPAATSVRGKTVVIGLNYGILGDSYRIYGQNSYGGVFIAGMAAEGLKRGAGVPFGWLLPLLLAGIFAYGLSCVQSGRVRLVGVAAVIATLLALPTLVTYIPATIEVVPALVSFALLMTANSFRRITRQAHEDEIEGLGSVVLAEERGIEAAPAIICLVISNDAQIRATLSLADQRAVWQSLYRRISFAMGSIPVYRQGNCLFWAEEEGKFADLKDRLNGLHSVVRMPNWIGDNEVQVDGFFGVDMQPQLPLRARLAGAIAAVAGGSGLRVVLNDPVDKRAALWALTVSSEIGKGMERGDFWVAYQPQVDCDSGALVGAEALIRWQHPEKGFLDPAMFIAAAEKSGEIGIITDFVLGEVARDMRRLASIGARIQLSVNVSPLQLEDSSVSDAITRVFVARGGDCSRLTLELTETASLANVHQAANELLKLRRLGITLSADDYGSGASTLENLKASPVRELKIDKQFIQGMRDGNPEYHMVRSTVMMAHALNLHVVAEGVEDLETFELLRRIHCDYAQGYYLAKPMKFYDLIKLVSGKQKAA